MTQGLHFTGYAQANAGFIRNAANEGYTNLGATIGGEVNYKGTYLRAAVGEGTVLTGKIEAGHEFDIGKNMGLDLSANAQASRSNYTNQVVHTLNANYNDNGEVKNLQANSSASWQPGETRVGAKAQLTFKSSAAKFGVGLEGGMRRSVSADIVFHDTVNGTEHKTEIDRNKTKGFVTPTVSAEVKLGKKSNFSFVANADMYQGQAGIRYTF